MDVLVERFQRRKDVTDPNSQKLYYLRQKPKTCGKYGAQNEMYIEGWTEKGLNLLIYKRLCNI